MLHFVQIYWVNVVDVGLGVNFHKLFMHVGLYATLSAMKAFFLGVEFIEKESSFLVHLK